VDGQGWLRTAASGRLRSGRIKQGERVFADETTLPTLAPGSGKTQKAWLWAYARDDRPFGGTGPPMVAYRFEDNLASNQLLQGGRSSRRCYLKGRAGDAANAILPATYNFRRILAWLTALCGYS
jgi:Transposase IS66 family